jgi:hypothetical protein
LQGSQFIFLSQIIVWQQSQGWHHGTKKEGIPGFIYSLLNFKDVGVEESRCRNFALEIFDISEQRQENI